MRVVIVLALMLVIQPVTASFASYFTVTPGVEYKKGMNNWKNKAQSIHTVEVDVNRPEITVDAIIPNPLSAKTRLTTLLKNHSKENNFVVAGINASFFHVYSGAPSYLLASDGFVNTYGVISTGNDEYMNVPSAFAIDKNGQGQIGKFGYEATVNIGGVTQTISTINKAREAGETILYTPSYTYESTRASTAGIEFVITGLSSSIEEGYPLGKEITAKVSSITPYGSRDSKIPPNGVVISIHGGAQAKAFEKVKVGDDVSLSIDLSQPFQGADFVLASGPLLVQNGKVDMTIDPRSYRARSINPRTAVAVNKDGSKVFLVTVDGRNTNSTGMSLHEFSEYLVSIGAHAALNLDGGGSTTMAVRKRGDFYPSLFNNPSDKSERAISASLGVISKTKVGAARTIAAQLKGPSALLVGGKTTIEVLSGLDSSFHPVPINTKNVKYGVTGNIGTITTTGSFTATKAGKGTITATYDNATQAFPIEVLSTPTSLKMEGSVAEVGANDQLQLTVKAYDAAGKQMAFSNDLVKWTVTPALGTISANGLLTTNDAGSGTVTASVGTKSVSTPMKIMSGGQLVDSFEKVANWEAASARAKTTLRFDGTKAPVKDGTTALTLSYDFTNYPTGTSASYAVAKTPIALKGKPTNLGLWVYGDGNAHWLRGQIIDHKGEVFTINFTENNELNWKGWKYVKAAIPSNVAGPVALSRIYIAETSSTKKNRGSIYIDRLMAEYGTDYKEPLFNDVPLNHRAADDIAYAVENGWIQGYPEGDFKPDNSLTRAHATVLISRMLNLTAKNNPTFKDVPTTHRYANEIAAVVETGIMSGKDATTFDPQGLLTRAQMAKILVNSYELTANPAHYNLLQDVPRSFWAFDDIHILQANKITIVNDGLYRPFEQVKRYQIAAFLTRAHKQ